jgi:hypothetical protein
MNNNSSNKNYKSIYEQSVSQTTRLDLDEEVYAAEVTSTRQLDDEEINDYCENDYEYDNDTGDISSINDLHNENKGLNKKSKKRNRQKAPTSIQS